MSAQLAIAEPRRIKATHRRRRRIASGRFVQRYYDPQIGMFRSIDPVSVDTKTAANFCRYCYAANNPYKFTDPDGRDNVLGITAKFVPDEYFPRHANPSQKDIDGLAATQKSVDLLVEEVMENGTQEEKDTLMKVDHQYDPMFARDRKGGLAVHQADYDEGGRDMVTYYSDILNVAESSTGSFGAYGATFKGGNIGLKFISTHEFAHSSESNKSIENETEKEKDANKQAYGHLSQSEKEKVTCSYCSQ